MIDKERPDALLPTLGGGTALNLARDLYEDGTLERYGVELIGANYESIQRAEDRELFNATMTEAGLRVARNSIVHTMAEAERVLPDVGLPAIIRPGFTMGGEGGGIAYTEEEYRERVAEGLAASPIGQVLIDESVIGWGEFELEVMRDHNDNVVVICSIENVDPMGVHTGDSVTVAPQQTLTDKQYQELRDQALKVIRAVGVETGGSNVQFAVNPETDEIIVIEMNPRVSRSSRARVEGDRLPDREDRGAARGRLRARGDRQRHHQAHAGVRSSRRSTTSSSSGRASRSRSSPAPTASCRPTCSRSARRWRSAAPSSRRTSRRCARASSTSRPSRRPTTRRC